MYPDVPRICESTDPEWNKVPVQQYLRGMRAEVRMNIQCLVWMKYWDQSPRWRQLLFTRSLWCFRLFYQTHPSTTCLHYPELTAGAVWVTEYGLVVHFFPMVIKGPCKELKQTWNQQQLYNQNEPYKVHWQRKGKNDCWLQTLKTIWKKRNLAGSIDV